MHNLRPFEIILIGVFGFAAIIGLISLTLFKPDPDEERLAYGARVEIWGTLDERAVNALLDEMRRTDKGFEVVAYVQKDARTFDNELLNAIAEGKSPDLIILPHTLLATYRTKLQVMENDERTFRSNYIDGAEIFMRSDGTYGIPFAVDPLVMYWNRDIFSSSGLALPPKTWETLMSQTVKAVTKFDDYRNIRQSAVALGEYTNIAHAKAIISTLFFQAGSTIVEERDGTYAVALSRGIDSQLSPAEAVLPFYTQFALPTKEVYSWNRSKNLDRTEFVGGTLGLYFGKGSERTRLIRDNANLNFDVAPIPQGSGVSTARNYGDFYAFSIPRASMNPNGAYQVALKMSTGESVKQLTHALGFAPVLRSLYTGSTGDSFEDIVYQSALIARGWLDPAPRSSDDVFRTMIEQTVGGQARTKNVVLDAIEALEALF